MVLVVSSRPDETSDAPVASSTRGGRGGETILRLPSPPPGTPAGPHDLPPVVHAPYNAIPASERAEVGHRAVFPKDSVPLARGGPADPHDLPEVVHGVCLAIPASEVNPFDRGWRRSSCEKRDASRPFAGRLNECYNRVQTRVEVRPKEPVCSREATLVGLHEQY